MLDQTFDVLDLDLFPSGQLQLSMLDMFEDGSKDSLADILPDILGHGFDHLSALSLDIDDNLNLNIETSREAKPLVESSLTFGDMTKLWPSQLDLLAGPLLEDDDVVALKEQPKSKVVLDNSTHSTNGHSSFVVKSQGSVHSLETDSDLDIESGDDVDVETVDCEMKGKTGAEILSAKLANLTNDCQAARVRAIEHWKTPGPKHIPVVPSGKLSANQSTGPQIARPKKVNSVKVMNLPKAECKLKDCNPSMVIEKIKQSSTNRRGSILISHEDVLQKCKTTKSTSKSKPVKSFLAEDHTTLNAHKAVDHDYCYEVQQEVEIFATDTIDCLNDYTWLESDNCMVVEEVVENCTSPDVEIISSDSIPLVAWTDCVALQADVVSSTNSVTETASHVPSVTSEKSDAKAEHAKSTDATMKDRTKGWQKETEENRSCSRSMNKKQKKVLHKRSKHYSSSCSPSNSSSSRSAYRSCSRSPNRYQRRRRNSRYSRSSSRSFSRSRSRSWSRSRSRSWSRTRDYPRFKRKERRSPSPVHVYQSRLPNKKAPDEKTQQINERRVIFVGKIPEGSTKTTLRQRFGRFGPIQEVSVHFRDNGDNYGFVTFMYKCDAYEALEHGNDNVNEPKFDLCFGGRRQFCRRQYADLDSQYSNFAGTRQKVKDSSAVDFDSLLNAAKQKLRKRHH